MEKQSDGEKCAMEVTIELIGGKWKALILWHLVGGRLRYGELKKRIPRATAKMLTQHLRDLERDCLIRREVYPVVPPKVEYFLTDCGRSLVPILNAMCDWGETYLGQRKKCSAPIRS